MRMFICSGKGSKSHLSKNNNSEKLLSSLPDNLNSLMIEEMTLRSTTVDLVLIRTGVLR